MSLVSCRRHRAPLALTLSLLTAAGSHWPLPNRQRRQQATPSLRSCHLASCRAPTALPSRQQLPFILLRPRPHKISLLASRLSVITSHHPPPPSLAAVSLSQAATPSLHPSRSPRPSPPDSARRLPNHRSDRPRPAALAAPDLATTDRTAPHRLADRSLSSRPARALILTATTSYPLAPPPSARPRNYARPSGKPPPRAATAMRGAYYGLVFTYI